MKAKILSLSLAAACLSASAFGLSALATNQAEAAAAPAPAYAVESAHAPDPALHVLQLARLFRNDDVRGIAQALVPPQTWEEARLVYELQSLEPSSERERERFAADWERMTAPDAVERLMEEAEPKLAKAREQLPGALLMGFAGMHMAVNSPDSGLTDEQRRNLQAVLPGIQHWATSVDFLSSDRLRHALTLVTDALRDTGIDDLDALKAVPMEQLVDRFGPVLAAAKAAVREYGIDLDSVADSLQAELLSMDEDVARIRATITVLGGEISGEHELVLVDGRWYGKHMGPHFKARGLRFDRKG